MILKSFRRFSTVKNSSNSILKRELLADSWQMCLKYTAYSLSGSHAMYAELQRTTSDFLTHIYLYRANKLSNRGPDENYNYGI